MKTLFFLPCCCWSMARSSLEIYWLADFAG
jgi:hypothetical protein